MKNTLIASLIALLATTLISASAQADQIANPAFDSWTNCAVGSSVTYQQTTGASGHKVVVDITKTLSEKAADHDTLDTSSTMTVDGKASPAQSAKETVPAKLDKQPDQKKGADETIEVGGKKVDCKVMEMEVPNPQGSKIVVKIWTSDEIPGGLVKMSASGGGADITMQLKSFEKK